MTRLHFFLVITFIALSPEPSYGLQVGYYSQSCPALEKLVKNTMQVLLLEDATAPAALTRLAFHDCAVAGCDASILLESTSEFESEMDSPNNFGIRRLDFINKIKKVIEAQCPGVVSCADILVLAARDSISAVGGPQIPILTGRKDSLSAYKSVADNELPLPISSVEKILNLFTPKGFTLEEIVAILGSHTLGVAHCQSIQNRLQPTLDPSLTPLFGKLLQFACSRAAPVNNTPIPNDSTNIVFDNQYFRDLTRKRGLLTVDENFASDARTGPIVKYFSNDQKRFFNAFSTAFLKLTQIDVLTEEEGQVRKDCSYVNMS